MYSAPEPFHRCRRAGLSGGGTGTLPAKEQVGTVEYQRFTTSSTLLESLKDAGNDAVWRQFDARYRPLVAAVARRMGLGDEDAAEVAQQTLAEFARAYRAGKYERGKGRLSAWIIGIARYRATDILRAQAARREQRGESGIIDRPAKPEHLTQVWEAERRRAILQEALLTLRT